MRFRSSLCFLVAGLLLIVACTQAPEASDSLPAGATVAATATRAKTVDGQFISWREHIIDDEATSGVAIRGSDGLVLGDLDRDGFDDVVSVHEADTSYDGVAAGHVRIAFGSESADRWQLVTLAEGKEAGAAEDVAVADANGDGYPDVVVACELAHLVYFQNPGGDAETVRSGSWPRVILPMTLGRGSFIRVFFADFDGDGRPEVVTANKGEQNPALDTPARHPISWFELPADPLDGASWVEHELARVSIPINSRPVDLDGDGDLDVLAGSRGEFRIFWFENLGASEIAFAEHPIEIIGSSMPDDWVRPAILQGFDGPVVTGFNFDFADLSGDGRLDIVLGEMRSHLVWLQHPAEPGASWQLHTIGDIAPDQLTGFALADINGDGHPDVMVGGYSQGPRDRDGPEITAHDPVGRIAWFENPGGVLGTWQRHDVSRRKRGMYDKFIPRDQDGDGDVDFLSTRGNSVPWDGVFWLEQVHSPQAVPAFAAARSEDSEQMPLPDTAASSRSGR